MIQITQKDIQETGGFISTLTQKSSDYIRSLLRIKENSSIFQGKEKYLERIILHTDPHLDEYFAELLFRSCLPKNKDISSIDFIEQSLFSENNDLVSKHLWPTSAIFGIGRAASGGANALFLFDEHTDNKGKSSESSAQIVVDKIIKKSTKKIPHSILNVLREINTIDAYGFAYAKQHLNHIIKDLNSILFLIDKGCSSKNDKKEILNPSWKRALINACIVSIIYCLENQINIFNEPNVKAELLNDSFIKYSAGCMHKEHPYFSEVHKEIIKEFKNQNRVFKGAVLRDYNGEIKDKFNNNIPQLLVISRILFACHNCWGERIAHIIMIHFWEVIFQNQLMFKTLINELNENLSRNENYFNTKIGKIYREILPEMQVDCSIWDQKLRKRRNEKKKMPLWIIGLSPNSDVISPHRAVTNFIKNNNYGFGLILIENPFINTKALFKGQSFPDDKWDELAKLIMRKESKCWHNPSPDPNKIAPILLNGNKAHQYRPLSSLDVSTLSQLVSNILY